MARQIARERKRREIEPVVNLLDELRNDPAVVKDEEFKKTLGDLHDFTSRLSRLSELFLSSGKNWLAKIINRLT